MAPRDIEQQTKAIIGCLFDDDTGAVGFRRQDSDCLQTDGPGDDSDDFDPVPLADMLREVADQMMTDPRFQDVTSQLLSASAEHVGEVFSKNVQALCRAQPAEVTPEIQMTRTAIALGLYLKKTLPQFGATLQNTLISFLNQNVGDSLARNGGWDAVANAPRPQVTG